MKFIKNFHSISAFLLMFSFWLMVKTASAQSPGDIAILGVNSDDPDNFAFITLKALPGNYTIYFTDGGFIALNPTASATFRNTEGFLSYTTPAEGLPDRTIIILENFTGTPTVTRLDPGNTGTASLLPNSLSQTNAFSFSTSGEQLIAYTVTSGNHLTGTPVLIAFVNYGDFPYNNNTNSSNTPTIAGGQVLNLTNDDNFKIKNTVNLNTATISDFSSASNYNQVSSPRYIFNDLVSIPIPAVNLSVSATNGTETNQTAITLTITANGNVTGNQTLTLNVSGAGITAGDYTLSSSTLTILSGQSTTTATFTIQDDVDVEGNEIAVLTISNPSSGITLGSTVSQNITIIDNDNVPEIDLQGNNISIPSGSTATSFSNFTLFDTTVKTLTKTRTFKILNTGNVNLNIFSINSSNTAEFTISGAPSVIAPNSFANFTITFQPNDTGNRTATITINNDDTDESSYTFVVAGHAVSNYRYTTAGWSPENPGFTLPSGVEIDIIAPATFTIPSATTYTVDKINIEPNSKLINQGTINGDVLNNGTYRGIGNVLGSFTNNGIRISYP